MFKFGFSEDQKEEDSQDEGKKKLTWFPAIEIKISEKHLSQEFINEDYIVITPFDNINIKLIKSENVVLTLKKNEHENIIKAESQHSDLLPAIYEGGLKLWECSYDLANYCFSQNISFECYRVLDLGCGTGILGILALLKGSTVHFQDYNAEVIQLVTIPNVLLNCNIRQKVKNKAKFYAGDWKTLPALLFQKYPEENDKYDLIFTCETIYNSENHRKLYEVFKQRLKKSGVGYIAGKTYYFGVGGNMRQFEGLIGEDKVFNVESVWKSEEGLQREILKLTYRL